MAIRPDKVTAASPIPRKQERTTSSEEPAESQIVRELLTPKQWLDAASSGKIGFRAVLANEYRIPSSEFDAIVTACNDVPGF